MPRTYVAKTPRQHDGFVITTEFAIDALIECAKVSTNIRATEFVIESGTAHWSCEHNIERTCDSIRFAKVRFPGLFGPRDKQIRNGKTCNACLWLSPTPGCPFVTNFTARTGRRTRIRRDRGRMVVGLHFHQNSSVILMTSVLLASGVRKKTTDAKTFNDRCIVGVRDQRAARVARMGLLDHGKQ